MGVVFLRWSLTLLALAGLAVAGVTELVLGWPFVALVAFGVGLVLPFGYYAARRDRRPC